MENSERDGNTRPSDLVVLRNLYAGQEATVRTGHGTTDWFQIGYVKAVYCQPAYLTYQEFKNHMWPVATKLYNTEMEHFHPCRKCSALRDDTDQDFFLKK